MRIFSSNTLLIAVATSLFAVGELMAEVSLHEALSACEASVVQRSDVSLRSIGSVLDEDERGLRLRVETSEGSLMAMYLPPQRIVSSCILWGRHPELESEFAEIWQDWVEWEEVSAASEIWLETAMNVPGSVDLTNHSQPGFVVARYNSLENGVILASQPSLANVWRQVLPNLEPKQEPIVFFQFSVTEALPNRCHAAVEAQQGKG